ncbi:MAG: allantoicase [Sandaracinaceae bacterium]|nr:allantoicase [Sandaracinaceae bacterium]
MTVKDTGATFAGLIDLAAEEMGGKALATSDDFFAEMQNLLKPGRGIFLPDEYTDRGKWMDGWESRRKREDGYDTCIVKLGVRGVIRAVDIDTNHFLGNHPPFASLEATSASDSASAAELANAKWVELVPQSPLRPGSQNLFAVALQSDSYTHVRLHIYPDGGVARMRIWGSADPDWSRVDADESTRPLLKSGEVDLASVRNGALALACSDAFFGPMNNLIAPGRAANMGGGWETRRKRLPGNDWILVRLGAPGEIELVEIDTNHFKGNFPDRFALRGIHAPDAQITDLIALSSYAKEPAWQTAIPETKLRASERHFFRNDVKNKGPFTHLRLDVFPDGGISRLRVWGKRS